jgi:hypothetical protein
MRIAGLSALLFTEVTMNRSYPPKNRLNPITTQELSRKTAFHEAGHAAAIYLGNRQKQLPPVFFQICRNHANMHWLAKVEGGRLIHTLPLSIEEAIRYFTDSQKLAYLQAFEADIINLLVGPLAEANYIALRDDEIINSQLITLNTLHFYGGSNDLKIVQDYMTCFGGDAAMQEQKLTELFLSAFYFINDGAMWRAITALANYLLVHNKHVIDCEEISGVLDAHFLMAI